MFVKTQKRDNGKVAILIIENVRSCEKYKFSVNTPYFSGAMMITKVSEQSIEEFVREGKNVVLISGIADEESIRLINEMSYRLIFCGVRDYNLL